MKRNLSQFQNNTYDILVIGGGIYGACIAWDAALRGLSVALIEMTDFGQGASSNSLKIIHGGLRYLQDGNLAHVRKMSRERRAWIKIAPHLVRSQPFLMPTKKKFSRSRLVMRAALAINDLLSFDRNWGMNRNQRLPNGRLVSKQYCLSSLPGLDHEDVTGGAIWYDAQIINSERILLSILETAVAHGAHIANYVEAVDFLQDNSRVKGVKATDKLTGEEFKIKADFVVNCAGALADAVLFKVGIQSKATQFPLSTATNIITRQLFPDYAVALPGREGQVRFIVPWQEYSMIGTIHKTLPGYLPKENLVDGFVETLLDDVNFAYPAANLKREDVVHIQLGFLPTVADDYETREVNLLRKSQIQDHEAEDDLSGLISVKGVKYTTARGTAEKVIDLIYRKSRRPFVKSQTVKTPILGGDIHDFTQLLARAKTEKPVWLSEASLEHLVQTYGTGYSDILSYRVENLIFGRTISSTTPVLIAEIIHAIRVGMAQTLGDVIRRRINLGEVGCPDDNIILRCADFMSIELNWTNAKRFKEIQDLYNSFERPVPDVVKQSNTAATIANGTYESILTPTTLPVNSL